jgi:Zn-dependent peptidase ImmA (M78 family)/transcriptional regulator with XRE-family HTH domain
MTRFNGERLKQARELAGLTQTDVAEASQLDQSYISLAEQNARRPSESVVETLALAIGFPVSFLYQPSGPDFPLGSILFRKKSTLPSTETARVRQTARLVLQLYLALQQSFKPLPVSIPRVGDVEAAQAAQRARSALGYPPDGPIRGLMLRLEKAGILVFRLPFAPAGFDAFSAWSAEHEARPVIALGQCSSGERERATLAHELGHLVLHSTFLGDLSRVEAESAVFSGEFLLPELDMQHEFAGNDPLTLSRLADLKNKWGVSMQFLLRRLEQIEIISPNKKSYWRGQLEKRGWLDAREPVAIKTETPSLLKQMLEKVYGAPVDARRLARELGVPPRLTAELLRCNDRERRQETEPSRPSAVLSFPGR